MNTAAGVAIAILVLLSGCAESPATAVSPSSSVPPTAAPPVADAETGAIAGVVTDDELAPISGARISIVETQAETRSDKTGAFTFSGLPPASYRLVVDAIGYEGAAKKATVEAGTVTNVSFNLGPLAVAAEPHSLTIPKVSNIIVDNSLLGVFNPAVNHSAICGQCHHTLFIEAGPVQILVENEWTATEVGPINSVIDIWWQYYDPKGQYHNALESYTNRESSFMPDGEQKELADSKTVKIPIIVEGNALGVSVMHKVNTWYTFAYVDPLPEGFTMLPPKN